MKLRILTALVLAPATFWIVGWSPPWLFLIVLLITIERGIQEYLSFSQHAGFKTVPVAGYVAAGAICLAQAAEFYRPGMQGRFLLLVIIASLLLTLILAVWLPSEPKQLLAASASTIFGILYVGFTLCWLFP